MNLLFWLLNRWFSVLVVVVYSSLVRNRLKMVLNSVRSMMKLISVVVGKFSRCSIVRVWCLCLMVVRLLVVMVVKVLLMVSVVMI